MQLLKKGSDVIVLAFFHDKTNCTVLNALKAAKLLRGDTRKRGIAVVKSRGYRGMNKGSSGFDREKGANGRYTSKSKKS